MIYHKLLEKEWRLSEQGRRARYLRHNEMDTSCNTVSGMEDHSKKKKLILYVLPGFVGVF